MLLNRLVFRIQNCTPPTQGGHGCAPSTTLNTSLPPTVVTLLHCIYLGLLLWAPAAWRLGHKDSGSWGRCQVILKMTR